MDVQAALNQLEQVLRRLAAEPLAAPLAAGLGALLVAIFLLHTVAKSKKERTGTVYEGGVRRSTRQVEARCPQQRAAAGCAAGCPHLSPTACLAGSTRRRRATTRRAPRLPRPPVQP